MKCSCAVARSVSATGFHLRMKSCGVIGEASGRWCGGPARASIRVPSALASSWPAHEYHGERRAERLRRRSSGLNRDPVASRSSRLCADRRPP